MTIQIFWSDKLKVSPIAFKDYVQKQANRFLQGDCRYGKPKKEKKYLTRLEMELKAYKKTGNAEHLYNIAVYGGLEIQAPQHPKFHFDNSVDSVTRNEMER